MTDFTPQSSDQFQRAENPNANFIVSEGSATITSLSAQAVGYVGYVTVSLSDLNLEFIVPEIEVLFVIDTSLGGGVGQRQWERLPYVSIDTNGNVLSRAYHEVQWQYSQGKEGTPLAGTSYLFIGLYHRTSSTGQTFYYKIKSTKLGPP